MIAENIVRIPETLFQTDQATVMDAGEEEGEKKKKKVQSSCLLNNCSEQPHPVLNQVPH